MKCTHDRQVYLGTTLPCPRRDCPEVWRAPDYAIAVRVPRDPFAEMLDLNPYAVSAWRVIFERSADHTRWVPHPCIDANVDQALTAKLVAAGLEGALIGYVKPVKMATIAEIQEAAGPPTALDALSPEQKSKLSNVNRRYDNGSISFGDALLEAQEIIAPTIAKLTAKIADAQARAATPQIGVPVVTRWNIPRNPTPEPWRPTVDDWDLLPDA